jgi:hypothetical protein
MRNVMLGGIIMKEYVSEEEWDAVDDFFREQYKEKHPIRYWIEEIRFKLDMIKRKFTRSDDIPF